MDATKFLSPRQRQEWLLGQVVKAMNSLDVTLLAVQGAVHEVRRLVADLQEGVPAHKETEQPRLPLNGGIPAKWTTLPLRYRLLLMGLREQANGHTRVTANYRALADVSGLAYQSVRRSLRLLVEGGHLRKVGRATFEVVSSVAR